MPKRLAIQLLAHAAATAFSALVYAAFGPRVHEAANRLTARADVYQTGFDSGYDRGYAAGRRIARPVVVPHPNTHIPARLGP